MRYGSEHKAKTRERIIRAAGLAFRKKGYRGIGLGDLMGSVGLTTGGFYAHFKSKDDLFAQSIHKAFEASRALFLKDMTSMTSASWLKEATRRYLSRQHRDDMEKGCPLPPLSSDIARAGSKVKQAFEEEFMAIVSEFEKHMSPEASLSPREQALALLSTLVGSLILSRAMHNRALSDQILHACRKGTELFAETGRSK